MNIKESLHLGKHEVKERPIKFAFVFPGQGSQEASEKWRVLYNNSAAARDIFNEADEALGFRLSTLCFEGPKEELRQTVNAQPAILTMSVACLREAQISLPLLASTQPAFVAGHSLGEYTAMVAANVMSFSDAIRLVRERGRLMQEAGQMRPGGMAAIIGLDETSVERICWETGAQIANLNSADQIVLSGDKESLIRAMDLGRSMGAKRIIPLDVSGAFHSTLMEPAAKGMAMKISQTNFDDPSVPIVANSTASPIKTAAEAKHELNTQLLTTVRWRHSVEFMAKSGVDGFIEIGPGNVLSGLIRHIDKDQQVANINADSALARS